jgi:tRNA-(ms[2]io[6]A)-hydroxylase
MKLLAEGLQDEDLAACYTSLLASEARHHVMYTDLAKVYFPAAEVVERLQQLALHEAKVLATPGPETRLHS